MVKNLYQISDDCKSLREEIHRTVKARKKKLDAADVSMWADKTLRLQSDLAKKADEILERLVRLEDEVRQKVRPEMLRKARKVKTKKAKKRRR